MEIYTTRFGQLSIDPISVLHFPAAVWGLEECTHWVLLGDADNGTLGWLQSTTHPEVALAVVSPRTYVADYRPRVLRSELGPLADVSQSELHVLAIVSRNEDGLTLNLKAPLLVHLAGGVGRQVIVGGSEPLQYEISRDLTPHRNVA